ncbi:hypothetical protein HDU93_000110 [Gonapodya sp. JEL0774]|nr:hypothetical protein HDU93_000110 [Gonapodya sp. JEL0774]
MTTEEAPAAPHLKPNHSTSLIASSNGVKRVKSIVAKKKNLSDKGFGRELASTEKRIRDKAVSKLTAWMRAKGDDVTDGELARLWKGLFYCFWMSDKRPVQHQLAETLATISLQLPTPALSIRYIRAFWLTLVHEWNGVDRLRIDKFYLLCRMFHRAAFKVVGRSGWDAALVEQLNEVLVEGPLNAKEWVGTEKWPLGTTLIGKVVQFALAGESPEWDKSKPQRFIRHDVFLDWERGFTGALPTSPRIPDSLRYHTCEVYLDELSAALAQSSTSTLPANESEEVTDPSVPSELVATSTTVEFVPRPDPPSAALLLEPFVAAFLATPLTPFFNRLSSEVLIRAADSSTSPVLFDLAPVRERLLDAMERYDGVLGKHKSGVIALMDKVEAEMRKAGLIAEENVDARKKKLVEWMGLSTALGLSGKHGKDSKSKKRKRDQGEEEEEEDNDEVDEDAERDLAMLVDAVYDGDAGIGATPVLDSVDDDGEVDGEGAKEVAVMVESLDAGTTISTPPDGEVAKKKRKRRKKKHLDVESNPLAAGGVVASGTLTEAVAMEDVREEAEFAVVHSSDPKEPEAAERDKAFSPKETDKASRKGSKEKRAAAAAAAAAAASGAPAASSSRSSEDTPINTTTPTTAAVKTPPRRSTFPAFPPFPPPNATLSNSDDNKVNAGSADAVAAETAMTNADDGADDSFMWEDMPVTPSKDDAGTTAKSVGGPTGAGTADSGKPAVGAGAVAATTATTRIVKKGVKWVLEKNKVKTFHKALPVANFPSPIRKDAVPGKPLLKQRTPPSAADLAVLESLLAKKKAKGLGAGKGKKGKGKK